MKKKQVDEILIDQTKRRKRIISYSSIIIIISFLVFTSLYIFINNKKIYYVTYKEDSNIDYKVYLKDNNFFNNNYIESNNQYIASLIDYINTTFKYKLSVEDKNINYKYQYNIESNVKVTDKNTNKVLYEYNENLINNKLEYSNGKNNIEIIENIDIDYNKYNDLIKKFVSTYNLEDSISTLNINMYVKVLGDCEDIEDIDKTSTISLNIPLTTKTIAIDISKDLVDVTEEKFMLCTDNNIRIMISLIFTILFSIVDIIFIIVLTKYIIKTRTAETIYQKELKKILNNYKSYIQKINNIFDLKGYQVLNVDTFTDMLEIRDTLNQPILMVENKENTGVHFIIPSSTKILYVYTLKVSIIKKRMKKELENL